jgi:hypothetical protein
MRNHEGCSPTTISLCFVKIHSQSGLVYNRDEDPMLCVYSNLLLSDLRAFAVGETVTIYHRKESDKLLVT